MTRGTLRVDPARAERPLVVAVDVGTSSVRAAIHDLRGRTVRGSAVHLPYAWDIGADGAVRLPSRTFVDLVNTALDGVDARAATLAPDVVAGGISCFLHSIVGLDSAGKPVTPVLSWADTSSASEAATLRTEVDAAAVHAATGAPIHASYWPARVRRLRQEHRAIDRWAGLPDLLAGELTGRSVMSRSMASGTGLLDRASGNWSGPVATDVGIGPEALPEIADDAEAIGRLSKAAARRWHRFAHVDWFAAWGDGGCGNVGLGAADARTAALMVGTSGALRTVMVEPAPRIPAGLFAQRLGSGAVVGGQLSEGGGTLAWLGHLLRRSRASLEREAATLEPDGHGLTVLPYVFGERGLGYHDDARGGLTGFTPATDAPAIYRAMLESIALGFAAVDDELTTVSGRRLDIVASGGTVARSPALRQMLADALGRDIGVAAAVESSRRGAALLALRGLGLLGDIADVPSVPIRTVRFDADRTAIYQEARARREVLYGAILRSPSVRPAERPELHWLPTSKGGSRGAA